MALGIETLVLGLVALLLLRYLLTRNLDFWKKRGVNGPRPIPIIGNGMEMVLGRLGLARFFWDVYEEYKAEPYVGIFLGQKPMLLLRDPGLIQDVMQADFSKFTDRFPGPDQTFDFAEAFFVMEGPRWKPARRLFSPMFTLGKLKELLPVMTEVGERLQRHIEDRVLGNGVIELRRVTTKYTLDTLCRCILGMDPRTLECDTSEMEEAAKRFTTVTPTNRVRDSLKVYMPIVFNLFGSNIQEKTANELLTRISGELIEERFKSGGQQKGDLVGILADLKRNPDKIENSDPTDKFLAAQYFIFYTAGFETSSLMLSYLLYELAVHTEIQERLREEIKEVLRAEGGAITMEGIKRMNYMDMVCQEVLRIYPVVAWTGRTAVEDYTFRGTNLTIPKGTSLVMSITGLQNDPEYHPNPERFDPERFNEENIKSMKQMSYIPFGAGPRNCIGLKFAYYQVRVGLIHMLQKYRVELCERTKRPVLDAEAPLTLQPVDDEIYLGVKRVQCS